MAAVELKEVPFRGIAGIRLGHAQNSEGGTGCTAIICEKGAVAGCDVRGGGPATHETDLLRPENMVQRIHSVLLTGGSAYGLEACAGVMAGLEARGVGFNVGVGVVPIVCGAALFDLYCGDPKCRPDRAMGREACDNAFTARDEQCANFKLSGNLGAGTGAAVGKLAGIKKATKGGVGVYAVEMNGIQMGAVVAVNAVGDVVDSDGTILAGMRNCDGPGFSNSEQHCLKTLLDPSAAFRTTQASVAPITNTTIACLVTNTSLTKANCTKLASVAHDAFARSIRPVHTNADGDSIFVLSTAPETVESPDALPNFTSLSVLATVVLETAVRRAILSATSAYGIPCGGEVKKINGM
jgi:L-aminopeptidase/D-esterase-like protein